MLQLENVRLEQVEQLHAEEQIQKNSQAEEQIRKLKGITSLIHWNWIFTVYLTGSLDEIQRKAIENMNLAGESLHLWLLFCSLRLTW
jgi:hypothetical protein